MIADVLNAFVQTSMDPNESGKRIIMKIRGYVGGVRSREIFVVCERIKRKEDNFCGNEKSIIRYVTVSSTVLQKIPFRY